jgi:hypothetical protein
VRRMANKSKIKIEYTEEFLKHTKVLSDYIFELKMCKNVNDELVNLVLKQLELAENEAFTMGFKAGIEYNLNQILEQEKKCYSENGDVIGRFN